MQGLERVRTLYQYEDPNTTQPTHGRKKKINKIKYILFRERWHRDSDMSYKNKITWAKINQIRLWEPLEIQSKKHMKYAKEFGYAGEMLPILINYMGIHHTLTYWGIILSIINPIHITYSCTYPSVIFSHILSHLSITYPWYASLLTMAVTILLGEAFILLIKLYSNLLNTTLIWSVAFIANARLELVYLGTLIRRLNVSL